VTAIHRPNATTAASVGLVVTQQEQVLSPQLSSGGVAVAAVVGLTTIGGWRVRVWLLYGYGGTDHASSNPVGTPRAG
jgi:hypothetical protein